MNVNFLEWDGLIRLCFGRKNKTLGAIFRQPSTLALMHNNYQLCQALAASGVGGSGAKTAAAPMPGTATGPAGISAAMDMDEDVNMSDEEGQDDDMDVDGDEVAGKQQVANTLLFLSCSLHTLFWLGAPRNQPCGAHEQSATDGLPASQHTEPFQTGHS